MPAAITAILPTTTLLAPPAGAAAAPQTVTGPVNAASFNLLGAASSLSDTWNFGEGDPRWVDRRIDLSGAKLFVAGKETSLTDAIRWLATAVTVNAKGRTCWGSSR